MVSLRISNTLDSLARWRYIHIALFAVGVVTRAAGWFLGGTRADEDGAYLLMAQNYLAGHGIAIWQEWCGWTYSWLPPGMSMLQIVFLKLFSDVHLPLRIFFIGLTATAIVSFFALAKKLFEPAWALAATLILLFYPPQWFWGSRINPHVYAMDGVVISIALLFLAWSRRSKILPLVIGLYWASITLMRAEFALGICALAFASLFALENVKERLTCAALLFFGFALGMAPWVARNYRLHHAFVLVSTNYGDNVWKAYNPAYEFKGEDIPFPPELLDRMKAEENEVARAKILTTEARQYILAHPERFVRNLAGNFLSFWRPWISPKVASGPERLVYTVAYLPIFILFVWGLFLIPWKNPYWLAVVGMLFYKNMINLPFYVIVLFREVVMPLIILIAVLPLSRNRIMENR
jgi:4-amino-4-deoxy-L-arabinose transferase-like glycosyltransferase